MEKFCETMSEIREEIFKKMKTQEDKIITPEAEEDFKKGTKCFICGGSFNNSNYKKKVWDHCHFTGLYRGAAHNKCNLDYCFKYFKIPIFFHNLKNYDAHLIISNLDKLNTKEDNIDAIAQNSENFITFCLKQLEFKDSFSFLSSSLDKLVKLSNYADNEKRENWTQHFHYSKNSEYFEDGYDLNL